MLKFVVGTKTSVEGAKSYRRDIGKTGTRILLVFPTKLFTVRAPSSPAESSRRATLEPTRCFSPRPHPLLGRGWHSPNRDENRISVSVGAIPAPRHFHTSGHIHFWLRRIDSHTPAVGAQAGTVALPPEYSREGKIGGLGRV